MSGWTDEARAAAAAARSKVGGALAAHQKGIDKLKEFAKSESGSGTTPKFMREFDLALKDPAHASNALAHLAAAVTEGKIDVQALVHFAHFLGMLATIAVVSELVQWVIYVV